MKNLFDGMFGMVEPGLCRMSMSGKIAIRTQNGYKTYDVDKERLTNCDGFVFNVGEEFFFVVPTTRAHVGDILLINGKPKCVRAVNGKTISVLDYEDSSIKEILPERHIFMGRSYFYGQIRSLFGNTRGGKGAKNMMRAMAMSSMFQTMAGKGGSGLAGSGMADMFSGMTGGDGKANPMMQMMMFSSMFGGGGMGDFMDGLFDFEDDLDFDFGEEDDESDTPKSKKGKGKKKAPVKDSSEDEEDESEDEEG